MSSKLTLAGLALLLAPTAAQAQTEDMLKQGRVLELGFALFAPMNTLQDTLTTVNGGGAPVRSTDILDFGTGGRVALTYSQPWGKSRFTIKLTQSQSAGTTPFTIGGLAETFPGSYDDGFNFPPGFDVDTEIVTDISLLSVGREWQVGRNWTVSAGLQGGQVSQDLRGRLAGPFLAQPTTIDSYSDNQMLGAFGGASRYMPIGNASGLRLSASVGVMHNTFDYTYASTSSGFLTTFDASSSSTAVSTGLSARFERNLSDRGVVSLEVGYEGIQGIGNGADTLIDPDGTQTSADIESDSIGGSYLGVGYAFRF